MSDLPLCPRCGAILSSSVLGGLCPACLLLEGARADSASRPSAPFTPPALAEMSQLFPQLEILELIGHGGMGSVYKARQRSLDRLVALKILAPQAGEGRAFAERFSREARALARLSHPAIVGVYEFGEAGRFHFFLMEYIDGPNLRQLQKTSRLSPRQALEIVPQICDALQYAHDQGIVHRDIKPENVLVDRKGRVKIADFGLAKILGMDIEALRLTGEGHVMGTPHYMAPEQIEHPLDVDHRADIYSLGVVFYEMLTGELPLGRFAPPSRKVSVDVRLDEIVLRALEKQPELRYQHASEVRAGVELYNGSQENSKAPGAAIGSNAALLACIWTAIFFPFLITAAALHGPVYSAALIESWLLKAGLFALLVAGTVAILQRKFPGLLVHRGGRSFLLFAPLLLISITAGILAAVNSPTVPHPDDEPATATTASDAPALSQGQIQLVAVAQYPSDGRPWWRPDGSPATEGPFQNEGANAYPGPDQQALEFVFRATGLPADASKIVWKIDGAASTVGGNEPKVDGKYAQGCTLVAAVLPKSARTTTVRAGAATGPWELVQESDGAGNLVSTSYFHGAPVTVSLLEPVENKQGDTVVTVSDSSTGLDTRLVAVDASGTIQTAGAARAFASESLTQRTFSFTNLPRGKIKKLLFQARSFSWVVFPDVALEPKRSR